MVVLVQRPNRFGMFSISLMVAILIVHSGEIGSSGSINGSHPQNYAQSKIALELPSQNDTKAFLKLQAALMTCQRSLHQLQKSGKVIMPGSPKEDEPRKNETQTAIANWTQGQGKTEDKTNDIVFILTLIGIAICFYSLACGLILYCHHHYHDALYNDEVLFDDLIYNEDPDVYRVSRSRPMIIHEIAPEDRHPLPDLIQRATSRDPCSIGRRL